MSSPLLRPLTVLFVSPDGRPLGADRPLDGVDAAIDAAVVRTADQALDRIGDDPDGGGVDAVVTDHDPPAVDGVAFVAAVRERRPSLPVVVVPSSDPGDCSDAALAAGATDVVQTAPSSLSPAVLANRIRQFAGANDGPTTPSETTAEGRDPLPDDDPTADDRIARLTEGVEAIRRADRRDAVAEALADATADVLDAPGIGVFLFDDAENLLRPAVITERMTEYYGGETVFGPGKPDSITWQAFVADDALSFDDIRTSGTHVNEDTDARSSLFVPLGEHGVLAASTDVVGSFSERARQTTELLSAAATATLDRVESAAALRERDRRLRETESRIRRVERDIDLVVELDRAVVAAETREEVETAVLDRLMDDDRFDFAWIGGVDATAGELTPREWTDGGRRYLDELSLVVEGSDEPSCRAVREWRTVTEANVAATLDGDGWERAALSRDFHSIRSVPLAYEGVLYGVLTVYADRPDAFTEPLGSVLDAVGVTAAHAINASERAVSILSDVVTELELRIDEPDDVLNVIAESVGTSVECLRHVPQSDGSTELLFSAAGVSAESVLTATAGLVAVDSVTHVGCDGDDHRFTAVVRGETVGSVIATSGGVPAAIRADARSLVATVRVPDALDDRTFVDRLARRYPGVERLASRERPRSAMVRNGFLDELESELTDRQLEVLRTAYESGFFRSPRDATGRDVADRLGVSQPTVSHHLRAGQGALFSLLFGDE